MKKQITAVILAVCACFSAALPAFAETVVFSTDQTGETSAFLAMFDSEKRLIDVGEYQLEKSTDGTYSMDIPSPVPDNAAYLRVVLPKTCTIISDVSVSGASPSPSASPMPEQTASPSATPEATTNPIYPKEVDAVNAFAVVNRVSVSNVDGETYVKIVCYYQGRETVLMIEEDEDIDISSAPDTQSGIIGKPLTELEDGDIIVFSSNLSGKIKTVGLVYRPEDNNPLFSGTDTGTDFEKLFSSGGYVGGHTDWDVYEYGKGSSARTSYAFGVIQAKSGSSITLYGKDGSAEDAAELDIEKNTVVYVCDLTEKGETELSATGAIQKSFISSYAYDEDDNITAWDTDGTYAFALARIVDDVVTDIAVYYY